MLRSPTSACLHPSKVYRWRSETPLKRLPTRYNSIHAAKMIASGHQRKYRPTGTTTTRNMGTSQTDMLDARSGEGLPVKMLRIKASGSRRYAERP